MTASRSTNTAPILALVAAEIGVLMAFVGVCELRAPDLQTCEHRWSLVLPAVALAGQSAATYFMDSGLGRGGTGPAPAQPRNALGRYTRRRSGDNETPA
jgi:hypothetical protein